MSRSNSGAAEAGPVKEPAKSALDPAVAARLKRDAAGLFPAIAQPRHAASRRRLRPGSGCRELSAERAARATVALIESRHLLGRPTGAPFPEAQ